jgi:hypothetical protein
MPQSGTLKRAQPRIEVLRGFDPNEPTTLTQSFPVAANQNIKSGQIVSAQLAGDGVSFEWVVGIQKNKGDAGLANIRPMFAYSDATDHDILEAGTLPALSANGEFEIEIPWFAEPDVDVNGAELAAYTLGTPVYAAFNDDAPDGGAAGDLIGYIRTATAGETGAMIRVGYLTRNHGIKDVTGNPTNNIPGTNSNVVNGRVVSLETHEALVTLV